MLGSTCHSTLGRTHHEAGYIYYWVSISPKVVANNGAIWFRISETNANKLGQTDPAVSRPC